MAFTLSPLNILNASSILTPMVNYNDGANNAVAHVLLDATGALISPATSALQTAANTLLAAIATNTSSNDTAALQAAGNAYIAAIAANSLPAGQAVSANSAPVVIASNQSPLTTNSASNATGGASTFYNAAQGTTFGAVKTSAASLYSVSFYNPGLVTIFVQVFDLAAGSITLGTTAPKMVFPVFPGGASEEKFTGEAKVAFATALTIAATTTPGGATAPTTPLVATVVYK